MSNKVNLRVERFSTFLISTYVFFITLVFLIGILTYINSNTYMLSFLVMGIAIPIIFSTWNCIAINWVGCNKPGIMFHFTLMRFLVNSVFLIFILYSGLNWFYLDVIGFGLTLFFTWFTLHMIEAFYSASFLKKFDEKVYNK